MYSLAKNGVPIINTLNPHETVELLCTIAKQEQVEGKNYPKIHPFKITESVPEQQVFFISGLPGIGHERAKTILEQCKTPLNALNCVESWTVNKELGEKRTKEIREVLESPYG